MLSSHLQARSLTANPSRCHSPPAGPSSHREEAVEEEVAAAAAEEVAAVAEEEVRRLSAELDACK